MTGSGIPTSAASARMRSGMTRTLVSRPELGAVAGAALIWLVFAGLAGGVFVSAAGAAACLNAAAPLGILAVAVALLMIAGEFDLSVGSVIGAAGMTIALLVGKVGWGLWPAIVAAAFLSAGVGLLNGWIVVRTRLPSFIVTLATLFILRGATIGVSRALTGRTQIGGLSGAVGYESARLFFASDLGPFRVSILWWLAAAIAAALVLHRVPYGNWILGTGGSADAARNMGVPVARVKVGLFVTTALAAWLVAALQAVRYGGADVLRGEQQEFRAIVAAVIGGTLLSGGYGSAVGAVFGALIFGMAQQGLVMAGIDAEWFQAFLGAMLLAAVLFNGWVRRRAVEAR